MRSIDGEVLKEPTPFYDLKTRFADAAGNNPNVMKTLDRVVIAEREQDEEGLAKLRALIEDHYFREASTIEYDVVVIKYHPVERYKNGKFEIDQLVGRYTKGA